MTNIITRFQKSKQVTLILIIMLFFMINWVSYSIYLRIDLSGSGRYKLTSASKKILRNLPEKATIEAYFSKDISEAYMQPVKQLRDFLEEYAASSRGRVKLAFLNPDDDEKIQQRAASLGIQPMPIGSVDRKKREVSRVFLSLAISYEDKTQVIPDILRQSQALEYFLTANIYKMAHPGERTLGYLQTNTEFSTSQNENPFHSMEILEKSLESFYGNMMPVKADTDPIPSNISILVIVSPKSFTDMEKYHIDQFIMGGGKVILAMSGVDINFNNLMGTPKAPDVLSFFQNYGIDIKPDLIFDSKNYIPFRQPVNMIQVMELPYPVWLASVSENLSQESLMTQNFQFLVFPWASSVNIVNEKIREGKTIQLAASSSQSWVKSSEFYISPEILKNSLDEPRESNSTQSIPLAYYVKGKFDSFYKGKPLPPGAKNFIAGSSNPADIVVVSTPFAFTNNIQPIHIGQNMNINFFLSIVDVMNGLDELVKSRNRGQIQNPTLGPLDSWVKNAIVLLNFMLPLLFITGYGILRFVNRKKLGNRVYSGSAIKATNEGEQHV